MSKYHDDDTHASDPGHIALSDALLRRFHPELYTPLAKFCARIPRFLRVDDFILTARWRDLIAEHVALGDSRAALVMTTDPLVVAAYTDELDCVALLQFEPWVQQQFHLQPFDRLLTVNTYGSFTGPGVAPDLIAGPRQCRRYTQFWPIIADFLTENQARLRVRKQEIAEDEWERTRSLAERKLARPPVQLRDGRPRLSLIPGKASQPGG